MTTPFDLSSFLRFAILFSMTLGTLAVAQDDEDEEEPEFVAGWVGTYGDDAGNAVRRIDESIAFQWQTGRADERLVAGPLKVQWEGVLLTRTAGSYQFASYAAGKLDFRVNNATWLEVDNSSAKWKVSEPLEFGFGWHAVRMRLETGTPRAEVRLFWRGPGFDWEPLNPGNMFHRTEASPKSEFSAGKTLATALRCASCHGGDQLATPSLTPGSDRINRAWVAQYLQRSGKNDQSGAANIDRQHRRMPYFDLTQQEASDLATYISTDDGRVSRKPLDRKVAAAGHDLFLKRGCVACHRIDNIGSIDWLDGGDLSDVGAKRSLEYLRKWLEKPGDVQPHHRMPKFVWTDNELNQMKTYLASTAAPSPHGNRGNAQRGARLYKQLECASCHSQDGKPTSKPPNKPPNKPLSRASKWEDSCAGSVPGGVKSRPRYRLNDTQQSQLKIFYSQRRDSAEAKPSPWQLGVKVFSEQNCVACHARGSQPGIASKLRAVADQHPKMAAELPAVTPPSLNSVGDKLNVDALQKAIRRDGDPHRDWLTVQMPKFELEPVEEAALIAYLQGSDAFPAGGPQGEFATAPANLGNVGARLVTTDGFGCTSCHRVGKYKPPKAPLNARGPDLAMLGKRVNRQWFERWVRNPARIVPHMEMPSIKTPIHGVLNEDLDVQLASVWEVLNRPGFSPPAANPLRTVRRSGASKTERSVTLTDVVRLGDQKLIKPLIVGLPNRHNLLFDLETASLAMWWTGDTARQRTEGKTWFWEVANPSLLPATERTPDVRLVKGDRQIAPIQHGQFITEFDWIRYEGAGLRFAYRLFFPPEVTTSPVLVIESLAALPGRGNTNESGWHRKVELQNVPDGWQAEFQVLPWNDSATAPTQGQVVVTTPDVEQPTQWLASDNNRWQIEYRTRQLIDQFVSAPVETVAQEIGALPDIVPGFRASALAVNSTIMPTGLTWLPDGRMVVCSLKGRVWVLNAAGATQPMTQLSDELAAPYGAAVGDGYVDVINKYAVLRLFDRDGDGFAEEVRTVASGWGHTADYHDWALGMPLRDDGGYYISVACQQDDRSLAGALHRGVVAELVPKEPTSADPRLFDLQPISSGHRFAMGIARNKKGQLFVTDNQGNYNPYNELNHVLPGKRYGFINKWERKADFNPPLTNPAINIPHPWTRSVNGICFLEAKAENGFGPFTGHLVGCEYDTRRIIRLSLQPVDGQLQGAAYPLSRYQPVEGRTFLGPLVAAVSPEGSLFVGGIRDSGWGGSNNIGALTRLDFDPESLPAGIAEVRATSDGFEIDWTQPIDEQKAVKTDQYLVESARRESTPKYGGDDIARRAERVVNVEVVSPTRVRLQLAELREGFVYEIRVRNIAKSGETFFPAEAFYTMRAIPAP
jgi:mono/diheme cytochrome c family protein